MVLFYILPHSRAPTSMKAVVKKYNTCKKSVGTKGKLGSVCEEGPTEKS